MRSESGFSIIGAMILLGAALTAILIISRSQMNLRVASKSLESVNSYEVFITSFTDFLHTSIRTNVDEICASQTTGMAHLTFSGSAAGLKTAISAPTLTEVSEVKKRCAKPHLAPDGRMYFCIQFDKNTDYPKDGFAGADYNFAEIAVRAVNKWQQPISCADYKAALTLEAGLQIYYRLYWITKTQPDRLFKKYGYYYGVKE